jgi:hypothetical protein
MSTAIKADQEIYQQLHRPLPKEAISQHPTKKFMSSIKAIFMVERLNEVFGLNGWHDEYEIVDNRPEAKMVVVRGKLTIPEFGITRTAFGGNDNPDRGDAYKGACTDALSKMCSMIGVGMDVYKGNAHEHTHDEVKQESETRRRAERTPKRQYETIDGIVTRAERMDKNTLWLQVNNVKFRAVDEQSVNALKDTIGKRIEVNAYWDTIGKNKTPVMTIATVLGVYEPVPVDVKGVSLDFTKGNI